MPIAKINGFNPIQKIAKKLTPEQISANRAEEVRKFYANLGQSKSKVKTSHLWQYNAIRLNLEKSNKA